MIFGNEDGSLLIYDVKNKSSLDFYCMNFNKGGISFINKSKHYDLFIIGGEDGSISFLKDRNLELNQDLKSLADNQIDNMNIEDESEVELSLEVDDTPFYENIIEKKFQS